jgi:hypothetical protein
MTVVAEHGDECVELIANKMNSNKTPCASYDRVNELMQRCATNNTSPIVIVTNFWDNGRTQLVLSDG